MQTHPNFAREMRKGEEARVGNLLERAFGGKAERRLVEKLRKSRVIAGETVLPMGADIVGYYALSYMVKPKGMLTEWARLTKTPVVVLGQPAFYAAAGFSQVHAAGLRSPYPIENTLLAGMGDAAPAQDIVYPAAFDGV